MIARKEPVICKRGGNASEMNASVRNEGFCYPPTHLPTEYISRIPVL